MRPAGLHFLNGVSEMEFRCFCRKQRVACAILFGSTAKGTVTSQSDVDLAFWMEGVPTSRCSLGLINAITVLLHRDDVYVVVLNRANSLLRWQVASAGKLLYERKRGAFRRFQVMAFRQHQDANRIYRWTRMYLNRVLTTGLQ